MKKLLLLMTWKVTLTGRLCNPPDCIPRNSGVGR